MQPFSCPGALDSPYSGIFTSEPSLIYALLDYLALLQSDIVFQSHVAKNCKTLLHHQNAEAIYGVKALKAKRIDALIHVRVFKKEIESLNRFIDKVESLQEGLVSC